jgi:anti-sigma factor RsiW
MNAAQWEDRLHEALDAGRPPEGEPQVAEHLAARPEDRPLCRQFERLEQLLRARRVERGGTSPEAVGRVMRGIRRQEAIHWAQGGALLAAAAALMLAVLLPLLAGGSGPIVPEPVRVVAAPTFEGYVDAYGRDPMTESEFVLAVVNEKTDDASRPEAFGQIAVQSDGTRQTEFFKNGRRVEPEVLADEVVRGRLKLSDPQEVFNAVARKAADGG